MGSVYENYEWDWEAASREYRKAIELSPSSVTGITGRRSSMRVWGGSPRPRGRSETARALDPLSPVVNTAVGISIT